MNASDRMPPQQVIEILKKHGYPEEITVEQAEKIVEFMRMLAEISLEVAPRILMKT